LATYPLTEQLPDTSLLALTNRGERASGAFWTYASLGLRRESALVQPIAVDETIAVRIQLPSPWSGDTMLEYRLWTSEATDGMNCNDSAQLTSWAFPAATYSAQGFDGPLFPPPAWAVADSDGGIRSWARTTDSAMSHSGTGCASCTGESAGGSNDWLTSGTVYPTRNCLDSVGFFVRNRVPLVTNALEIWALSEGRQPVMLLQLRLGDTTYSRHSLSLDQFDGSHVRVAFRFWSWSNWRGLYLDDVWLSRVELPPRDIVQRSLLLLPELAFTQNPATGDFVAVRCSLASAAGRRLTLRNIAGQMVRTFVLDPSGVTSLDLRGFTPGVYIATLRTTGQSVSRKLVITAR
jgi:hypothetical protein